MRNLILFLIAFIAVVTFIRAFDRVDAEEALKELSPQTTIEGGYGN